jgi:16S rRNA (cytosine1402-N4)-methyltransferase
MPHQPVLLTEVLDFLKPSPGQAYLDATVGGGGHTEAILQTSSPDGKVLGLDRDTEALQRAAQRLERFGQRCQLRPGSFADVEQHLEAAGWHQVNGAIADLGLSSLQLDDPERGFSFAHEGPLDMRFDQAHTTRAADIVNRYREKELADLIFHYGEERRSRAIARRIVSRRPLTTTADLRRVIHSVTGPRRGRGIDPATRTFQALRIAVNQEMDALVSLLRQVGGCLRPGGRVVVISYHSLEDREVKLAFRSYAKATGESRFRVLTPKPIRPTREEVRDNRRARAAKLRALERVD